MKNQAASVATLVTMLLFPSLAGCQSQPSAQPTEPASALEAVLQASKSLPVPDPNDAPPLNPDAKAPVRLSGKLGGGMHIKFHAIYAAVTRSYECRSLSPSGKPSRRPGQYRRELKVEEASGRFESSFSPDLFVPGVCKWQFMGIGAEVSTDDQPGRSYLVENLVEVILPRETADESGCVATPEGACPLDNNWLQTPVLAPCGMLTVTDDTSPGSPKNPAPFFSCRAPTKGPYKATHRLKGNERQIDINFVDLRTQPDPT